MQFTLRLAVSVRKSFIDSLSLFFTGLTLLLLTLKEFDCGKKKNHRFNGT